MSNANQSNSQDTAEQSTNQSSGTETVVATSYVPEQQYQQWEEEADKRDLSISEFISSRVQAGMTDIQLKDDSPSEIVELRESLREARAERDKAKKQKRNQNKEAYHIGLGKIKELIISDPGIDHRELVNFVVNNPVVFVDKYIDSLEESKFTSRGGKWYPPEEMEDLE
ncbi:hypothetical protein PM030_05340 [Halorubrum ezzemoulense]|uniref:hypothetical protein n=1 Tax=Halorubrum ezzemoulense TaxID=337243 RepID=UPI00232B8C3C|nr:hypothetical protein [Halorubrum ezzemoulense]MDB2281293.1 hypothetical protein [Halorubrum ezzemoulense]